MRIQCSSHLWQKLWFTCCLLLACLIAASPALAATPAVVSASTVKVYAKPTKGAKVIGTLKKGDKLTVVTVSGNWAKVSVSSNTGYLPKTAVKKQASTSKKPAATKKKKGVTVKQVQQRLAAKGYMGSSAVTGSSNDTTSKALRIFQMMNNLSISGRPTNATVKKLMSGSARKRIKVSGETWSKCGINSVFHKRGTALLIDMTTGARIAIRRVGGHNHLDVEPKTKKDTATLKRVYGGTFSWDSRPALLIAGGKCFAAAMNSMPHGAELSKTNGYDGQFCVHLRGSITHGTEKANPEHQSNVEKVYQYFH